MSKDITGFVAWLRQWFDSIYAPVSHNHNSLYYTKAEIDSMLGRTYDDIVMSVEKPILSYEDNDKTDLYAQLMYGEDTVSISGITITFKQGSTVLGTAMTDNTGLATLTDGYSSQGLGDVSLTATDGSLSETYTIEDCVKFDNALSDKTSNYSFKNNPNSSTIIYDSIDHYYTFNYPSRVSESNASQLWILQDYDEQDVEVMIDVCFQFTSNKQIVLYNYNQALEWNNHSPIGTWTSNSVCGSVIGGSNYRDTSGASLSANTWYTFKFRIKGNTIETYIIQNGSVIREKSTSAWSRTKINSVLALSDYLYWCRFKNVKVKPL